MDDLFVLTKTGWNPDNAALMLDETLFHNANGLIGVRGCPEEGYPAGYTSIRGQYLNGFYDLVDMKQAEQLYGFVNEKQMMLNVVDTQGVELRVNGERFTPFEGKVEDHRRTLDLRAGTTERRVVWTSPKGHRLEVAVRRMASFALLPLFTLEYTVTNLGPDAAFEVTSTHRGRVKNFADPKDPRVAAEAHQHVLPGPPAWVDGASVIVASTSRSGLTAVSAVAHQLSVDAKRTDRTGADEAESTFGFRLAQGQSATLTKRTVLNDSVRCPDPRAAVLADLTRARSTPLADWYAQQRAYLDHYWDQCAVHVEGDPDLSRAVVYNLYQLLQSVGKDPHANLAAKGLSGEGYEGHYFWDTEIYLLPFFSLNFPELARNLIAFRHATLDAARDNARILGHSTGALFPWRTIMGKECSGYYPSGTAQYHINADIAYSVVQHFELTRDLDFLATLGAEILFETARLWLDVGHEAEGAFRIHGVTGPDEYTCLVNNNTYTNLMARHNLRWAVKAWSLLKNDPRLAALAGRLGLKQVEIDAMARAADLMLVPYDEKLGIHPQDDTFLLKPLWDFAGTPADKYPLLLHFHPLHLYRHQVCKQADTVLAHFLLSDQVDPEVVRRSFTYYEGVTTHDSSLSTCIFSIVAAQLGNVDQAYRYFDETSKLDLLNTHGNTKDGIHAANMGGTYMGIVFGFGGLRIREEGLSLHPRLPRAWGAYDFKIHDRGSRIRVRVEGEFCRLTLEEGEPRIVTVYGRAVKVEGEVTLRRTE